MSGQYNRQWPNGRNQFGITQDDMEKLRDQLSQKPVATCIGCGCDDEHACADDGTGAPCSWVRLERNDKMGVCSACPDHVERWDLGDRQTSIKTDRS